MTSLSYYIPELLLIIFTLAFVDVPVVVLVVLVVVVFTLKAVPVATQYFLTSVLVQLTRTPSFRGHRLTIPRKGTHIRNK